MNNENIRLPSPNIQVAEDESTKILSEVFNDIHTNLYCDYYKKLEVILSVFNTRYFLAKANKKVEDLVEQARRDVEDMPRLYTNFRDRTLGDSGIRHSVFQGVCTLKEELDVIVRNDSIQKLKSINLYEILDSLASDSFKELFDSNKDEKEKADILFSIIFDEKKLNGQVWENEYFDESEAFNKNYENQKKEVNQKILVEIISKIKEEFKPLEKKLTKVGKIKTAAKKGAIGGVLGGAALIPIATLLLPPIMPIIIGAQGIALLAGGGALAVDVKLGKRKEPGWYQNVEKKFINYFNSKNNESDKNELKRLLDDEALENDKQYFIDQLESFFSKYDYRNFFEGSIPDFRLRKIHEKGFLLTFESSWTLVRELIFKKQEYINRQHEIERELIAISENIKPDEYMPLFWFKLLDNSNNEYSETVSVDLLGSSAFNAQKLKGFLSEAHVNATQTSISINRSSLHKLVNILSTICDFKFKGLLIRDCNIAIGAQVLYPAYNRHYGRSLLPEEHSFDLSSFKPTYFDWLPRGSHRYYCPNGWLRYSLRVEKSSQEFDKKYEHWPVAYHGTSSLALIHILKTGFKMSDAKGCCAHGKGAYFSPSIEYSAHNRYAKVMTIKNRRNEQFYLQAIFQCRLNPTSFIERKETLLKSGEKSFRIDPNYSNEKIEWLLTDSLYRNLEEKKEDALVIYGIMVRITKQHPRELPQSAWWLKCHFQI